MTKAEAIAAEKDADHAGLLSELPPSYFKKFTDLKATRQTKLIKHFQSEFYMTEKAARKDLLKADEAEIAVHLDAALNGYI